MIYILAGSLAFSVISIVLFVYSLRTAITFKSHLYVRKSNRLQKLKIFLENRKQLNKKCITAGCATGILFVGTTVQANKILLYFSVGFVVGFIALSVFDYLKKRTEKDMKLKEISALFEAVELYVKANYSLVQALRSASILTPKIRPFINRCLSAWPISSKQALEGLRRDLDVPEAEILVSILTHMERSGVKGMKGALEREAYNIERLRNMKAEIRIVNRPLMLMFYRILPLFSVLGIVVGSLLYRALSTMIDAGILNILIG